MSKKYRCCSWCDGAGDYKDFRRDHGGGPEELPHRKKGRGKKYCKKNKGEHVYDTWTEWQTYSTTRYRRAACRCGKQAYGQGFQRQFLVEYTSPFTGETYQHWA